VVLKTKDSSSTRLLLLGISARSSHSSPPERKKTTCILSHTLAISMMDAKRRKAGKPGHILTEATSLPPLLQGEYAAVDPQAVATSRRMRPKDAVVEAHQDLI